MKKQLLRYFSVALIIVGLFRFASTASAVSCADMQDARNDNPQNQVKFFAGGNDCPETGGNGANPGLLETIAAAGSQMQTGLEDDNGNVIKSGLIHYVNGATLAMIEQSPSSEEYVADLLNNIGVPQVNNTFAQSTSGKGYSYLSPFLQFWKVFRNLAYSLYIIIFVVIGVMIMLRTKVNAQTIITIQSALPNLLITLILITFSYAIVGFLVDLMYFLIYFIVYLAASVELITTPTAVIDRLMNNSARGVIFEGRNSIIRAVSYALTSIMNGLGGGLELLGRAVSAFTLTNLLVSIAFTIASIKLLIALAKSYVMLLVQLITAPLQILMNALPGSKAFSNWLKKTVSYLAPFPIAAAMFIFAAILIGDPTDRTYLSRMGVQLTDANPFTVNPNLDIHKEEQIWLPPFTLQGGVDITNKDILTVIGFVVFLMTPAAVKMAQDALQVKESPYTAEAFSSLGMGVKGATMPASMLWKSQQEELAAKRSAKALGGVIGQQADRTAKRPPGTA